MPQPDTLAQLAAEMVPCPCTNISERVGGPTCSVCGPHGRHLSECERCGGTGQVPLVPGLRKDCPENHYTVQQPDNGPWMCAAKGCPGYTVRRGYEGMGVLLEWPNLENCQVTLAGHLWPWALEADI